MPSRRTVEPIAAPLILNIAICMLLVNTPTNPFMQLHIKYKSVLCFLD